MLVKRLKKILPYMLLFFIVFVGFIFRLKGIQDNHSFWADEAYTSSIARDFIAGKIGFGEAAKAAMYQPLNIFIITFSFSIFGFTEFAARLPSVLFGTAGIFFAFLLGRRLSNIWGGLLGSFLMAFSQLNLANSTQAKPYIAIQALSLLICFLLSNLNNKRISLHLPAAIGLLASFMNTIGVLIFIPYIVIIIASHKQTIKSLLKSYWLIPLFTAFLFLFFLERHFIIRMLTYSPSGNFLFPFNHLTYLKALLFKQYFFFVFFAFASFIFLIKKQRAYSIGILFYILFYLYFWTFKHYTHNIRYLVPLFGLFFVLFSVFWAKVGERLKNFLPIKSGFNFKWLIPFFIIVVFAISQHKIVLKPMNYYSPNTDFYGDVQIADYKTVFKRIGEELSKYKTIVIFNDVGDAQRWYLKKQAHAYFIKGFGNNEPIKNDVDGIITYKTLGQFLAEKSKYPKGLLIVEDWDSFLPEDIKQYAKKNMKREFRVENLPQAKNDPWPLAVYSWGMD